MKKAVSKIFLDHIALVSAADNEVIDTVVAVDLKDVPENWLPPISTIGFGRKWVSSARREPSPPARITACNKGEQQELRHSSEACGCSQRRAQGRDFVELTSALDDYSKDIAGEDNHTWSSNTIILRKLSREIKRLTTREGLPENESVR